MINLISYYLNLICYYLMQWFLHFSTTPGSLQSFLQILYEQSNWFNNFLIRRWHSFLVFIHYNLINLDGKDTDFWSIFYLLRDHAHFLWREAPWFFDYSMVVLFIYLIVGGVYLRMKYKQPGFQSLIVLFFLGCLLLMFLGFLDMAIIAKILPSWGWSKTSLLIYFVFASSMLPVAYIYKNYPVMVLLLCIFFILFLFFCSYIGLY